MDGPPDGEVVGRVTSGGQGFTTGESIAYAWIPATWSEVGTKLTVEVFGESVAANVASEPRFDPTGARIRA